MGLCTCMTPQKVLKTFTLINCVHEAPGSVRFCPVPGPAGSGSAGYDSNSGSAGSN